MSIKNLVAQDKLREAIQLLIDGGSDVGTVLMGRYNRLISDTSKGIVPSAELRVERNRIAHAILDSADDVHQLQPYRPNTTAANDVSAFNQNALLRIVSENKRRRPEIAQEAQNILNDYRAWLDEKAITPSFDPVNRRLKALQARANELVNRLSDEQDLSLEAIVARIAKLIESPVPEYHELKEAFDLARGRGMASTWIEQQLNAKPADNEVRIRIAEKIEEFTASIRVV